MIPKKRETDGTAKSQWIAPAGDIVFFLREGRHRRSGLGAGGILFLSRSDSVDVRVSSPGGTTISDGATPGHKTVRVGTRNRRETLVATGNVEGTKRPFRLDVPRLETGGSVDRRAARTHGGHRRDGSHHCGNRDQARGNLDPTRALGPPGL